MRLNAPGLSVVGGGMVGDGAGRRHAEDEGSIQVVEFRLGGTDDEGLLLLEERYSYFGRVFDFGPETKKI